MVNISYAESLLIQLFFFPFFGSSSFTPTVFLGFVI